MDIKNLLLSQLLTLLPQYYKRANKDHGDVYKIEFFVNKDDADKMLQWWQERYTHLKLYSVLPTRGEQCTTAVKTALQAGGIRVPDITQTPQGLLNDLRKITSTSDKHKGEKIMEELIIPKTDEYRDPIKPFK